MYQRQTRPKCTILSQKFKKSDRAAHRKFWVSPWGRKKDRAESLNTALPLTSVDRHRDK